jgi:2-phospho-L-lactate guanylyltransferase
VTPVVIPAKPLHLALSRLSGLLSPAQRLSVQVAMLTDVIRAGVGFSDTVMVVSADPQVEQIASDLGAQVVADTSPAQGIDVAVERGIRAAASPDVLVLMGDLPLATSADLHAVSVALGSGPGIVCAMSADGTGTNAMYLRPPGAIATQFGAGSLAAHLHGAAVRELEAIALPVGGLERDIDTPDDLAALLRSGHECATTRVCHSLGIAEVMSGATGSR